MVWAFFVLALGAIAFTVHIMILYRKEADLVERQLLEVQQRKDELEASLRQCEEENEEAKSRIDDAKGAISEYQSSIGELQRSIAHQKGEMERRGRFRV